MQYQEAINIFNEAPERHFVIVRVGQHEYYLYQDVVETNYANDANVPGNEGSTRTYIYGDYVNPHPRVKVSYKWFYLENAVFVRYQPYPELNRKN